MWLGYFALLARLQSYIARSLRRVNLSSAAFLAGCYKWRNQFLVQRKEVLDALTVVLERLRTIAEVQLRMGRAFRVRPF